jgi:hypothetical protein
VAPQSIKAPRVVSRKATGSQSQAVTTISVTAVSLRPVRDDEPDVTDVPIGHRRPGRFPAVRLSHLEADELPNSGDPQGIGSPARGEGDAQPVAGDLRPI